MPRTPVAWISPPHGYRLGTPRRSALDVRRVAALPSSQHLTGTPSDNEPRALKGRRGGTHAFLGRGATVPQSPWPSGQGGRPLDKCLVQLRAEVGRATCRAGVWVSVISSPVMTRREEKKCFGVRGGPVDRRGHMSVPARVRSRQG